MASGILHGQRPSSPCPCGFGQPYASCCLTEWLLDALVEVAGPAGPRKALEDVSLEVDGLRTPVSAFTEDELRALPRETSVAFDTGRLFRAAAALLDARGRLEVPKAHPRRRNQGNGP